MLEIIDLSQEIYSGMPVFSGLPEVKITLHVSHEEWDGVLTAQAPGEGDLSPAVNRLEMGEHTGTHVDALNHSSAGAFPLYRPAAQDPGRHRLAGAGGGGLRGVRKDLPAHSLENQPSIAFGWRAGFRFHLRTRLRGW